ncbi:MAG TPA: hypothetical protein VG797_01720 [Phycisphaerales bacterium]|nr:hypothetical protein [Phycisphaerales bacterium]
MRRNRLIWPLATITLLLAALFITSLFRVAWIASNGNSVQLSGAALRMTVANSASATVARVLGLHGFYVEWPDPDQPFQLRPFLRSIEGVRLCNVSIAKGATSISGLGPPTTEYSASLLYPFILSTLVTSFYFWRAIWQPRRARTLGLCSHCRYDLRGLTSPQCPECGNPSAPIDRAPTT